MEREKEPTKNYPDRDEQEQSQPERATPVVAPREDIFPGEERDLDEEAHRQLEEKR